MDALFLRYPFDGQGRRVAVIPKYLSALVDDPYRSLAGLARKAGAYEKVAVPFSEFRWANFLRDKVDLALVCTEHLAQAIHQAVQIAHSPAAAGLPGYQALPPDAVLPTIGEIRERLSRRHGADDAAPDLPSL